MTEAQFINEKGYWVKDIANNREIAKSPISGKWLIVQGDSRVIMCRGEFSHCYRFWSTSS